jgi:hypothetical protein
LKLIHLAGTAWFVACLGYVLVSALRQAGVHWAVIFSLAGHSALLLFLVVSLYLFAIFRGVARSQKVEVEYPLTSTGCYMVFYTAAPFLGSLAGCLGMLGVHGIGQFLSGVALGTLVTTFLVWVVIDPAVGLLEMLSPVSRRHRADRLERMKAERERKRKDRERLLAEIFDREEANRRHWQQVLQPEAEKLAGLLTADRLDPGQAEREAADLGVSAWHMGGLSCMRRLRDMAIAICKENQQESSVVDYVSAWWDGIGAWRNPSL